MSFSSPAPGLFVSYRGAATVAVERLRIRLRRLVEVRDADASAGSLLVSEPPQPHGHTSLQHRLRPGATRRDAYGACQYGKRLNVRVAKGLMPEFSNLRCS